MKLGKYLDAPHFRGSGAESAVVFLQQILGMSFLWMSLLLWNAQIRDLASLTLGFHCASTLLWALFVLRSYMIFHDCGHGSFFQGFKHSKFVNGMTLHVAAIMCGTPTNWNIGHQLHHANVGNIGQDDYDWGETVFHTSSQFQRLSPRKQSLWRAIRHPIPFFLLAPVLTWYVRMRLPFELRPERKAAYSLSDKLLSTMFMFFRYKLAHLNGFLPVILVGDYLAMFAGVLLFHWQHVFVNGYVRDDAAWKLRDAAIAGSSLLVIPESLKFFTLGIEYHHIHHFRTKIPGYKLREVHEHAPPAFEDLPLGFSRVPVLGPREMWASLWLQCYDEQSQKFVAFEEVLKKKA